jgi:hypothetical protein
VFSGFLGHPCSLGCLCLGLLLTKGTDKDWFTEWFMLVQLARFLSNNKALLSIASSRTGIVWSFFCVGPVLLFYFHQQKRMPAREKKVRQPKPARQKLKAIWKPQKDSGADIVRIS